MKINSLICLSLLFSVVSHANIEKLSLDNAIEIGLKQSEDVKQSLLDIEKAQAQIKEAWSGAFPQISAQVQLINHTKPAVIQFNGTSVPVKSDYEMVSGLSLNQVLYSFGRVYHALKAAKLTRKLQNTALKAVQREVRYAIELAYYNIIYAQEVLNIARSSLKNGQRNKNALAQRYSGGRIPRFDNIKLDADIASRRPLVSDAEKSLKLATMQLNFLLRKPLGQKYKLTSSFTTNFQRYDSELESSKLKSNPNIMLSELQVEIGKREEKLVASNHYPQLALFGNLNHSGTGDDLPPSQDDMNTTSAIGISLNIPIYQGGQISARQAQAKIVNAKRVVALEYQRERLLIQLQTALEEYTTNQNKLKSAKNAMMLAEKAYELTRSRFITGGATRNDLNNSEMALTNTRLQYQSTLFQIHSNESLIRKLTKEVGV